MRIIIILLTCAFLLSGCAHEMPLEEAKKVSLSMVDSSFSAPPRKIDDILRTIEQHKDPSVLQHNIRLTEEQPTTTDKKTLGEFYFSRAQAARLIGKNAQAVTDLRMALTFLADWDNRASAFKQIAFIELDEGNYSAAIRTMKEVFDEGYGQHRHKLVGLHETMAQIYRTIGDYENFKQQATTAFYNYQSKKNYQHHPTDFVLSDIYAYQYELEGQWSKAEEYTRKAIEQIKTERSGGMYDENQRAITIVTHSISLSRNLVQQGKLIEAEIVARDALLYILNASGSDNYYSAKSVNMLAEICLLQGRLKDATVLAQKALDIMYDLGADKNGPGVFFAHFIIGKALLLERDWNGAFKHFSNIITNNQENGNVYLNSYYSDPNIGIALIKTGQIKEAEELFQRKYKALNKQFGESHYYTVETKALLAIPMSEQGKKKEALDTLREAYPILMSGIGNKETTREEERSFRLKIITNTYLDLLFEGSNSGNITDEQLTEAFRITEAARAGTVQKAIVDVTLRHLSGQSNELGDIIRRYQDLQIQIDESGDQLSMLMWSTQDAKLAETINKLKVRVNTLRDAGVSILKEIKKRVPTYDKLVNPTLITVEDVRQAMKPGEVLISAYPTDTHTYIWVVPYKGNSQIFKSTLNEKDIDLTVATLRKSLDTNAQTFREIPEFDLTTAYNLYEKLFKPAEPAWQGASAIMFVTHGSLGQLPLYVLPTSPTKLSPGKGILFSNYREVPWLIKKVAITTIPSLDSFRKIRSISVEATPRRPYIGFGDPIFNSAQLVKNQQETIASRGLKIRGVRITEKGSLDNNQIVSSQLSQLNRLPDTAEEIKQEATILRADLTKDVFLREKASKGTVKSMDLSDRKVIAFATHALVPGDLDGLDQPALALSSPDVAKDGEDGLLTMKDILKLKLNADWVILSACNTGAADSSGREAVSGLGRAFFHAGTKSVLVTMWPVETTSAMKLVTETLRLHKEEKLSRAEALRKSMLRLIDSESLFDTVTGKKVISYAHPLFWAPFVLVGDGSGTFE